MSKLAYIVDLAKVGLAHQEQEESILRVITNELVTHNSNRDPTLDELCLYIALGKIPAIKSYRARTGRDLREAKETLENAAYRLGLKTPNEK